jgi:hypothetical protein
MADKRKHKCCMWCGVGFLILGKLEIMGSSKEKDFLDILYLVLFGAQILVLILVE